MSDEKLTFRITRGGVAEGPSASKSVNMAPHFPKGFVNNKLQYKIE